MDGNGISALTISAIIRKEHLPLKELHVSGLKHVSDSMMQALGRAAPYIEVLDLSYTRQLHNSAIEAFVACESFVDQQHALETIVVATRDLGRDTNEVGKLTRRVTRLRHLVLSSCILLTDTACANLAFSVPKLEFLEMAGLGADLKDEGLICLLSTTPYIRRLDLEEAIDITDALLATITPSPLATLGTQSSDSNHEKQPGHALQQLNISYASNISDEALLSLIRNCTKLAVLEADNTRMGAAVLKEFVCLSRQRRIRDTKIVSIDCRGISENLVKELSSMTRPRLGWRAYGARGLMYLDARDDNDEDLKIGQDECDEYRVVVKTFYSWQTVDAVKAAKEKRRKLTTRRTGSDSSASSTDYDSALVVGRSARWWSPGGRRSGTRTIGQGNNSPAILPELNNDGCRTM
jgi:F-box/leucine-rich repeat protein 2/20